MSPEEPAPGARGSVIHPEQVAAGSGDIHALSARLQGALTTLRRDLAATEGMAGDDSYAETFESHYGPAADAVLKLADTAASGQASLGQALTLIAKRTRATDVEISGLLGGLVAGDDSLSPRGSLTGPLDA